MVNPCWANKRSHNLEGNLKQPKSLKKEQTHPCLGLLSNENAYRAAVAPNVEDEPPIITGHLKPSEVRHLPGTEELGRWSWWKVWVPVATSHRASNTVAPSAGAGSKPLRKNASPTSSWQCDFETVISPLGVFSPAKGRKYVVWPKWAILCKHSIWCTVKAE